VAAPPPSRPDYAPAPRVYPPPGAISPSPGSAFGVPPVLSLQPAGFWERFGASFLDGIIVLIGYIVLVLLMGVLGFLIALVGSIAYYAYFEGGARGQTPGKRAVSIRVADATTGAAIGPGRAIGRTFGKYISSMFFDLGFLWMLWDPQKQTWHDKMVGSVVVRAGS
jgi:uncharacterized RDD family membrane protein YckC